MHAGNILHAGGSVSRTIKLNTILAEGTYHLQMFSEVYLKRPIFCSMIMLFFKGKRLSGAGMMLSLQSAYELAKSAI